MGRPKKQAATLKPFSGITDIVPSTDMVWQKIMKNLSRTASVYGYNRIELPLLERAEVYGLASKAAPDLAARALGFSAPSGNLNFVFPVSVLPSIAALYFNKKLFEVPSLSKWWALSNTMSRYGDAVVSGFESSFSAMGVVTPLAEAQLISALWAFLKELDLPELTLEISTLGTPETAVVYLEQFSDFLRDKKFSLCDSCTEKLVTHPLLVLRCPNPECREIVALAPTSLDLLDDHGQKHLTAVLETLDQLELPYQLSPLHVGPAGTGRTSFAFKTKIKSDTIVVAEGGYFDALTSQFGKQQACMFASTVDLSNLYSILAKLEITPEIDRSAEVFLVPLGELAAKKSLRLFHDLLGQRVLVHDHFGEVGVKNQLKSALEHSAPIALIMGQKEAMDDVVILRDVKSGMQEVFSYDKIIDEVKKRLGK